MSKIDENNDDTELQEHRISREEDEPFLPGVGPAVENPIHIRGYLRVLKRHRTSLFVLAVLVLVISILVTQERDFIFFTSDAQSNSPRPTETAPINEGTESVQTNEGSPKLLRKGLVVASYEMQNVSWLQRLPDFAPGWEEFRYISDSPDTTTALPLPSRLGREAMAYMTFIIDNYHNLPDIVVFIHGDERAWHQPESMIDILMTLNLTAVLDEQFINLRCTMAPGCTEASMFHIHPLDPNDKRAATRIEEGFWQTMMLEEFGDSPDKIGRRCCAQFAVTKDAIRRRSLDFWRGFRAPLLLDIDEVRKLWGSFINQYNIGSMYESVWHIVFGKEPVSCPSKEHCLHVYFGGNIQCDGEVSNYTLEHKMWETINCTNRLRPTEIG